MLFVPNLSYKDCRNLDEKEIARVIADKLLKKKKGSGHGGGGGGGSLDLGGGGGVGKIGERGFLSQTPYSPLRTLIQFFNLVFCIVITFCCHLIHYFSVKRGFSFELGTSPHYFMLFYVISLGISSLPYSVYALPIFWGRVGTTPQGLQGAGHRVSSGFGVNGLCQDTFSTERRLTTPPLALHSNAPR
ncbi:unnamed protein product [Symbiodinium necroappetens]|uniref:Uncharacterized protein n=1 Tax=Symbiodinium necroappetens TaxID=1628268 RepID=A0A812IWR1_9DINO|nr:unnamed protein product [Symbiodinium necroappetens]